MADEKTVAEKAAADKAASDKVAADKAAADKTVAEREKSAAKQEAVKEGATSVAEAVKRVADAAVAAVQKVEPVEAQGFIFSGNGRGSFLIRGKGFSTNGVVKINGFQAETVGWGDDRIEGKVPSQVGSGSTTVEVLAGGKVLSGTFKL